MGFDINRGKIILENWDVRQKELEALGEVQGDLSKGIKREKYIFLRRGMARLTIDPTMDERIYAGMIRAIMEKLRKGFFPNPIIRKYMAWKEQLLIMPGLVKYSKDIRAQNFERIDKRINDMGITGLSDYLKSQLDYERQRIDLPLSSRFEQNNALEITLSFFKKPLGYELGAMEASLLSKGEFDRRCLVPERYGLHVNHAIYLLKGGAVRLDQCSNEEGEKWLQLDFEHPDEKGRFPLREHVLDGRFSLNNILAETAREMNYPAINSDEVLEIIKTGAQAVFSPVDADLFYLEANPGGKGMIFRDENQRAIPDYELKASLNKGRFTAVEQQLTIKKLEMGKAAGQEKGLRH